VTIHVTSEPGEEADLAMDQGGSPSSPQNTQSSPHIVHLPSLVLTSILKLLAVDFRNIRNFSYTCKSIRAFILDNIHILYTPYLHMDNLQAVDKDEDYEDEFDFCKRILSLKVTSSVTSEPRLSPDASETSKMQFRGTLPYKQFFPVLNRLDLSNIRSLEVRNVQPGYRKGFDKIKQQLPNNHYLRSTGTRTLEQLRMDVHLINLAEIRNSIINVLYQHDDFHTGGPITNIDYIVNSAVSQVLFNFLQFIDDLMSITNLNNYDPIDPYGKCYLKHLEINFLSEPDCDWRGPDLERENLNRSEESALRECLQFMIKEFKRRIKLKQNVNRAIIAKGIPNFFYNDVLELVHAALEESTFLWNGDHKKFLICDTRYEHSFDLSISFPSS